MGSPDSTKVADVMSAPVQTISASSTVSDAARAMRTDDINSLLVPTDPPGIITSTDILDVVAEGGDPESMSVGDVMTSPVETVPPDLRLSEVAAMMTSFGIKHLPVVDGDDYVGLVSSTDVAEQLS